MKSTRILVAFLGNQNCTTLCKGRHRFSFSLDILTGLACWQLGCIQGNDDLANLLYEQVVYYLNFVLMKGKKWFQVSRFWLHGHEHQGWRKVLKSGVASRHAVCRRFLICQSRGGGGRMHLSPKVTKQFCKRHLWHFFKTSRWLLEKVLGTHNTKVLNV